VTKNQRARLHAMFDGRCAYCGELLGAKWHADHIEPIIRKLDYVRGKGFVTLKESHRPEHDHAGNLYPACIRCNINKGSMQLEHWRLMLGRYVETLNARHMPYTMAKRFGLVSETGATVVFHFERVKEATP